ncbi:MAG: NADH:ubiquinone oxidoreductase [Firmicutes bacterium]|nr:NADH:ubiquinone oxidoreductase [Bacillota bacterium]
MRFIYDRVMYGKESALDPLCVNENSYGRIDVKDSCTGCGACSRECLVGAINLENGKARVDSRSCIYCGRCIDACGHGALSNSHDYRLADPELAGDELRKKIYKKFSRSLVLRSVDTGSCNACLLELSAMSNNYYSLSRYGIEFAASPRHADGIVVTGPVTINMKEALIKSYEAMAEPRIVIAAGACSHDGGIFKDSYGVVNRLDEIIPVDLTIPGCPPSPQAIIYGLLKLLDRV